MREWDCLIFSSIRSWLPCLLIGLNLVYGANDNLHLFGLIWMIRVTRHVGHLPCTCQRFFLPWDIMTLPMSRPMSLANFQTVFLLRCSPVLLLGFLRIQPALNLRIWSVAQISVIYTRCRNRYKTYLLLISSLINRFLILCLLTFIATTFQTSIIIKRLLSILWLFSLGILLFTLLFVFRLYRHRLSLAGCNHFKLNSKI